MIDGTNLYTYAHNSPGTLIDYWGSDSTSGFNWGNIGRAAGTIATGAVAVAGGAALLSNPIGWFALGGAMLLGSGAAGLGMGLVLLATSQTRTTSEDVEVTRVFDIGTKIARSPGVL